MSLNVFKSVVDRSPSPVAQPTLISEWQLKATIFILKNFILYTLLANLIILTVLAVLSFILGNIKPFIVYYETIFWYVFRGSIVFAIFMILNGLWLLPEPRRN